MVQRRTYEDTLNPEKALIFRIVHIQNIPWILKNGLPCGNSPLRASDWVPIGNAELIGKRAQHPVPHPGEGVLGDYVPFYFTPFSPMLLNIIGGRNGVSLRAKEDIAILVSSLYAMNKLDLPFLFSNAHAYTQYAKFYNQINDLSQIDWYILQQRDFARDQEDPHKMDRYQAEALVKAHVPVRALLGVVCYTDATRQRVEQIAVDQGLKLKVLSKPGWYF